MDYSSAREWLDQMSEINATAYARELFAKGKDFDAVVRAIEAQGRSRKSARESALLAQREPTSRAKAAQGTGSGVTMCFKLPREFAEALRCEADHRGTSVHKLVGDVMAAVIDDELFNAVLDQE